MAALEYILHDGVTWNSEPSMLDDLALSAALSRELVKTDQNIGKMVATEIDRRRVEPEIESEAKVKIEEVELTKESGGLMLESVPLAERAD